MNRIPKRGYKGLDEGPQAFVRVFAFCNRRAGYAISYSVANPVIILRAGTTTAPSAQDDPNKPQPHPCKQWAPLADAIFDIVPQTMSAVYVMDTSSSDPILVKEEEVAHTTVGPIVKRLSNTLSKLNPTEADIVAAGKSCVLAVKLALIGRKTLGHQEPLIRRIILVSPPSLREVEEIVEVTVAANAESDAPPPGCVIVLSPLKHESLRAEQERLAAQWEAFLNSESGRKAFDASRSGVFWRESGSLFESIAVAITNDIDADPSAPASLNSAVESVAVAPREQFTEAIHIKPPGLFFVDFERNRTTKHIVQVAFPTSLEESPDTYNIYTRNHIPQRQSDGCCDSCCDDDDDEDIEEENEEEEDEEENDDDDDDDVAQRK